MTMKDQIVFIVKLMALSTFISVAIKHSEMFGSIAPSLINTLIAISLPTLILAILLGIRAKNTNLV